jgi:hypothetical protein
MFAGVLRVAAGAVAACGGVHQRPALGRAILLQNQDRLIHQLMARPVTVVQVIKELLHLRGGPLSARAWPDGAGNFAEAADLGVLAGSAPD